jgi:hypothetical protein
MACGMRWARSRQRRRQHRHHCRLVARWPIFCATPHVRHEGGSEGGAHSHRDGSSMDLPAAVGADQTTPCALCRHLGRLLNSRTRAQATAQGVSLGLGVTTAASHRKRPRAVEAAVGCAAPQQAPRRRKGGTLHHQTPRCQECACSRRRVCVCACVCGQYSCGLVVERKQHDETVVVGCEQIQRHAQGGSCVRDGQLVPTSGHRINTACRARTSCRKGHNCTMQK